MRIGLLTLPLHYNYGGILQAYALQEVLKSLGHDVILVRYDFRSGLSYNFHSFILWLLYHLFGIDRGVRNKRNLNDMCRFTRQFASTYIPNETEIIYNVKELKQITGKYHIEGFVVGSDQVWNGKYTGGRVLTYFLDFCARNDNLCKIAYAVSFGDDRWPFGKQKTKSMMVLAKKFNAVSVREMDGVDLCKNFLSIDAKFVLDPTLLVNPKTYNAFIREYDDRLKGQLVCYILDMTEQIQDCINNVSKRMHLDVIFIMPELSPSRKHFHNSPNKCIWPPVEEWLSSIRTANMVITDSYHGSIFSIIYHKPFFVFYNRRGVSRIFSLLKMTGLEDCLYNNNENLNFLDIDWEDVDKKVAIMRGESMEFLSSSLNKKLIN